MKSCSVYEDDTVRGITGDTLRPGGFLLTDRAVEICRFDSKDKILDVGCGMGETVERLRSIYDLDAYGIDPSVKLLQLAKEKYGNINLQHGKGENIPYGNSSFKGVLAECTMSLMEDYEKTIMESKRVLEQNGYLVISDVYARKPENLEDIQKYDVRSCMRGLFDIDILMDKIKNCGFEIICFEDWTDLLKQLMVKIIFRYGSMSIFWKMAACSNCGDFQQKLSSYNKFIVS